ncbi:MAG: asparagine synthase (glutamine-hydrolyzing) [Coxiellaceae bacterium]|nr:asparagine synthase (glutamine-hydrolyzing) [Coxiellaceae bacterium]
MCGIFAAFNYKPAFSIEKLKKGVESAIHRGPDNLGVYSDEICYLGHTRLAIIDSKSEADQPFFFEHLVMTYNGELFNYIELRAELIAAGYAFKTTSDTEVIIKSYHYWGSDCFSKFNGMWALVIYDSLREKITVSRDRFGQKPLFITRLDNTILVASEIQQLTCVYNFRPDLYSIQSFLREGSFEVCGRTFFESVELFPKGSFCNISIDGTIEVHRYWEYWSGAVKKVHSESLREFSDLFRDAVRLRLRSDKNIPYGIMLSGGVDSTLVAAIAKKSDNNEKKFAAFTYKSHDSYDESMYAEGIASELNLKILKKEQGMEPNEYIERLRSLVKHLGRGHSSPAIVSLDYLYESMSLWGGKVSLDGQGADELLAGYEHYFPVIISMMLLRGEFRQVLLLIKDFFRKGIVSKSIAYIRFILPEPLKKIGRRLYGYEQLFSSDHKLRSSTIFNSEHSITNNKNKLNNYLIKQHTGGLENLLYYGDIVAMKYSIENRSPFMDYRLVDFSMKHAESLKIWNGLNKYVLRVMPEYGALRQYLERDKIGFSSNIRSETKEIMIAGLRDSPIQSWKIFSNGLQNFLNSKAVYNLKFERILFRLYQVHLWFEIFYKHSNKDF